jgi:hypothetical protein
MLFLCGVFRVWKMMGFVRGAFIGYGELFRPVVLRSTCRVKINAQGKGKILFMRLSPMLDTGDAGRRRNY